jgi:hypothetical protein
MSQDDRRYTDREVALILKAAAELDQNRGTDAAARGLSRTDLEEIAREAGISTDSMRTAIARVGDRKPGGGLLAHAPRSQRAVRAVAGRLDEEAQKRLIRMVDDQATTPGTVTEALGSIRWTSRDRFRTRQVTLTPGDDETSIQVSETASSRMARITHLVPVGVGLMLASSLSAVMPLLAMVVGVVVGLGAGRFVWNQLARKSAQRVQDLASELAREAGTGSSGA